VSQPTDAELKTEILSGPLAATLAASWAAGDDATTARLMNVRNLPGLVPIRELSAYCLTANITGGVLALDSIPIGGEIAAGVPMTLQTKGLLKTVVTLVQDDYRLEEADVLSTEFGAALDGLIGLGLATLAHKTALQSLAANRQSRPESLGWGSVSPDQIGRARNNG
jgi:hypothetical protein